MSGCDLVGRAIALQACVEQGRSACDNTPQYLHSHSFASN